MSTLRTRWRRHLPLAVLALAALLPARATSQAPAPGKGSALLGEWWTEGNEGRIQFTRARDGTFRGTSTCCRPKRPSADNPTEDIHNPNPKLRGRATIGIVIIWDLRYDDGEYSGGYVYNPRDGKTYRLQAEFIDRDTLRIRGYLGIPLLGQSQIWKRARPPRVSTQQPGGNVERR